MTTKTNNMPIQIVMIATVLGALMLGFWAEMTKLFIRWNSGDNAYCYLIVPLFIYLCWDQRRKPSNAQGQKPEEGFAFASFSWSAWGLIPATFAVFLILMGEIGSIETLLYVGIWLGAVGVGTLLYGTRIRYLWFNLLILASIAPLPPFINRLLTFKLKLAASSLSVEMLRAIDISVIQYGNIIDLGITQLQVVDACSGLRYLIPMSLMALLMGYFFCKGWWRRMILLLLVPPLSITMNALRIFFTGLLSIHGHEKLVRNAFHDFSGLLLFLITAVILACAAWLLKRMGRPYIEKPIKDRGGRQVKRYIPMVLTCTLSLFFVASGWAIKYIPSPRNLPSRSELANFPIQIGPWQGHRKALSHDALNLLGADDYVYATYRHIESGNPLHLLIPFYGYQTTRHTAHAPQSCMLGSGWDLVGATNRNFPGNRSENIPIRSIVWQQGDTRILAGYFFLQRGRVITSPWTNKLYLMWDGLTQQRSDGALVRAELQLKPGQSLDEAWELLSDFLMEIWPLLPIYIPE